MLFNHFCALTRIRRALHRAVVEVEAVAVDVNFHALKTQKPPCGGFVPGSPAKATTGRYAAIMFARGSVVNDSISSVLLLLYSVSLVQTRASAFICK